MLSVHFTAIFFPIIIFLALPLFPKNSQTFKYILFSIPVFILFLVPNIIYQLNQKGSGSTFTTYISENMHGFHLRRVIQLIHDALIQFDHYLGWNEGEYLKYFAFPLFFILYLYKAIVRKKMIFAYLVLLWFIVPWFVFAVYRGEISDYYFSVNRFIVVMMLSFIAYKVWSLKYLLAKVMVIVILLLYCVNNFILFIPTRDGNNLAKEEKDATVTIATGEKVTWEPGVPGIYVYYYLMRQKGIRVY